MRTVSFRRAGATWLVGGLAAIVGCVLPVLPGPAQLALALAVALPVVTVLTRSWLRLGASPRAEFAAGDDEGPATEASEYRLARWLTYLGFGTLALLTLRPTPVLTVSDWIFLGALVVAVLGYSTKSRGSISCHPDSCWPVWRWS